MQAAKRLFQYCTPRNSATYKIFKNESNRLVLAWSICGRTSGHDTWFTWIEFALSQKRKNLHAKSQLSSFCSFGDISVYIVGPVTDMARSPRLVILIKNKFTLRIRNATSYLLHTFRRIWSNLLLYEKRVWKHQCNNFKKNVNFFPIIPIEPIVVRSGLYKPIIQPAIKIRLLGRFHPNSFKSERLVA